MTKMRSLTVSFEGNHPDLTAGRLITPQRVLVGGGGSDSFCAAVATRMFTSACNYGTVLQQPTACDCIHENHI